MTLVARIVAGFSGPLVTRNGPVSVQPAVVVAVVLERWLPFLIYGSLALIIPASMMVMSFAFAQRPARRTRARTIPFESGVSAGPPEQQRFTVSFYLVAMLFILFDIEIVFLYPLAAILEQFGWFAVWEFTFFLGILVLAFVYVWRKGALEWQ